MPFMAIWRLPHLITRGSAQRWYTSDETFVRRVAAQANRLRRTISSLGCPDCGRWPEETRVVLFLGFSPQFYAETFAPVARFLCDAHGVATVVVSDSRQAAPAGECALFHSLAGHHDAQVTARLTQFRRTLTENCETLRLHLPTMIDRAGGSMGWPLVRNEFQGLFRAELPKMARLLALAEHVIERHRPDVVVTPDDSFWSPRLFTLLARHRGIPTLAVQQGFISDLGVEWRFLTTDRVAAFGPTSQDALLSHGVPVDRIVLTGCPRYDSLVTDERTGNGWRERLGLPLDAVVALLASQPDAPGAFASSEVRIAMLRSIRQAAEAIPELWLLVKPHPGENPRELRQLFANGRTRLVDRQLDIQQLIQACDVLITFHSTSAMMALIAGKPVLTVNFPGSGGSRLYADSGVAWLAESKDEIEQYLRIVTAGEDGRPARSEEQLAFVQRWTYLPDGRAAERVADIVLQLINR